MEYLEKLIGGEMGLKAGEISNKADQEKIRICGFCDEPMPSDHSEITNRGLSIVDISFDISDGAHEKLLARTFSSPPHDKYKRLYTAPSYMKNAIGSCLRTKSDEVKLPHYSKAPTF